jgi:hypothetical protein
MDDNSDGISLDSGSHSLSSSLVSGGVRQSTATRL